MSFSDSQIASLSAGLERRHVKERKQAGRKLSYIEGWQVISEANRIFGFDAWSSETIEIRCVSEAPRKIGEAKRDGFGVSYIARVRVTVKAGDQLVTREGVGSGHGIDVDLGLAHESAIKESETDARKRALMTFGNPFGLALYDKDQANVVDGPSDEEIARTQYVESCRVFIREAADPQVLRTWWTSDDQKRARRDFGLSQDETDSLKTMLSDRLQALAPRAA